MLCLQERRRRLIYMALLGALCAAALTGALAWEKLSAGPSALSTAQTAAKQQTRQAADYTPPEKDPNAAPIAQTGLAADAEILRNDHYALMMKPPFTLNKENACRVDFANPSYNGAWLLLDLRLAENNLLLYRTGLIAPGEALVYLPLEQDAADVLRQQGANASVTIVVYSFELNTYASMGEMRLTAPLTTDAQTTAPAATESAAPTPAATTPPPGTMEDRNG